MTSTHPWLGEVTHNALVGRLKHGLASLQAGGTPDTGNPDFWSDTGTPWVAISDMSGSDLVSSTTKSLTDLGLSEKRLIPMQQGTLLYSMYASLGHVAELAVPAVTNQAILGLTFNNRLNSRYAFWQLKAIQPYVVETASSNTQDNLNAEKVRNLPFAYPELCDQERIANFLDDKTARIDALIAEKERLIALLREHWTSIVAYEVRAVDEIESSDWKQIALKRVTLARCDGPFGSALASAHYVPNGARVVRLQNIRFGEFDSTDAAFIDDAYFERDLAYHAVREGDLLIAGLGDDKNFVGRACVAPDLAGNALVKADCFRFRLDTKQVVPEFVALQLSANAQRDGGLLGTGSTRQRIPLTVTESRQLSLPSHTVQLEIVLRLARRKQEHTTLEFHCSHHISLLREYRSSLISAAVTGQLDVRVHQVAAVDALGVS